MTAERVAYNADEVAEMLGWSRSQVYYHAVRGHLPGRQAGSRWLFPRRAFDVWLNGGDLPAMAVVDSAALQH